MSVASVLASSIWTAEQSNQRTRLATGCLAVDNSLNGGFDYGSISCISADAESGSKELSYALIASHLLLSDRSDATIIDTTNSFDVRRLHKQLVSLWREKESRGNAKDKAVQTLERVRIMKAFDFVGVSECIAELREALENREQDDLPQDPNTRQNNLPPPPPPRGTIEDSEDEEEMLDWPESPKSPSPPPTEANNDTRTLLVIDNIAYVTSPMLKNNHVQGQALLTTLMRSLAHLTRAHNICTIVHNTTVTYQSSSTAEPTPSIFSSCSLRPALGKTFAHLLDLHLLLHRVPVTAADAKAFYASHSAVPKPSQMLASVLEVIQDRHSNRVGHWSAFRPDADGGLAAVVS
ncbi:hypothetical protein Q7P37_004725 [Cladosporium fusiforme]